MKLDFIYIGIYLAIGLGTYIFSALMDLYLSYHRALEKNETITGDDIKKILIPSSPGFFMAWIVFWPLGVLLLAIFAFIELLKAIKCGIGKARPKWFTFDKIAAIMNARIARHNAHD